MPSKESIIWKSVLAPPLSDGIGIPHHQDCGLLSDGGVAVPLGPDIEELLLPVHLRDEMGE